MSGRPAAAWPVRLLTLALAALLLVAALRPVASPIFDPDFFWHLKTGDWIWEQRSLPREFLFTQTAPPVLTAAQRFTMTSYWAVQVLYHLLHALGGLTAIALLKGALMALLVATLVWRREGRDPPVFLGATLLGVIVVRFYPLERPQIFSFVFFSLLLLLLDRVRSVRADRPPPLAAAAALPPLMLAWANCHGGYLIGQGVIALYLAAEGCKFLHPALGPLPPGRYRLLATAGLAAIAAALVNPNSWHGLSAADLPRWATAGNAEYLSTVALFRGTGAGIVPVSWLLIALSLLGFALLGRKLDLTRALLVAATGAVSFAECRYLAFFVLSALPAIEGAFGRAARATTGRLLVALPALGAGLLFLPGDLQALRNFDQAATVSNVLLPVDAAEFIESAKLEGNMYNFWPWGGYLLWRLYPAKVFSDGRNSQQSVHQTNVAVETAKSTPLMGQPLWKAIFKAYAIRYAVLPIYNPLDGGVVNILPALAESPDWAPVFVGVNAAVFVEDSPDNRRSAGLQPLPRERFSELLLRRLEAAAAASPFSPAAEIARGELLARLHRDEDARGAYRRALRIAPLNPTAKKGLAALERAAP